MADNTENTESLGNGQEYNLRGDYIGMYPRWNEELQEEFTVYKYGVSGSAEAIKHFKRITEARGYTVHMDKKGRPIFFTLNYGGNVAQVKITTGGAIVINDEALRQLSSLANNRQVKGEMKQEIIKQGVALMLGNIFGTTPSATPQAGSAPVGTPEASDEDGSPVDPDSVDLSEGTEEEG